MRSSCIRGALLIALCGACVGGLRQFTAVEWLEVHPREVLQSEPVVLTLRTDFEDARVDFFVGDELRCEDVPVERADDPEVSRFVAECVVKAPRAGNALASGVSRSGGREESHTAPIIVRQ